MPKISVIVPVYNKKIYIEKCINSILNQTFVDFELIIINDGSTDGSDKICDKFKNIDSRIKVIHTKNNGVSNARNIGMENISGKYIQFIDCDDYIERDMFKELYSIMVSYNPDLIVSGITKISYKSDNLQEILPKLSGLKNKKEILYTFAEEQHTTGLYGYISNKFINRESLLNLNLKFDNRLKVAEDLDYYLGIYKYSNNIYIHRKSYYYYMLNNQNSSMQNLDRNYYLDQLKIILKEKNLLMENSILDFRIVDLAITNFALCFIYANFSWNYLNTKMMLGNIYEDNEIIDSVTYKNKNIFKKIIVFLLKYKSNILTYGLLGARQVCENLYRKFKYGS